MDPRIRPLHSDEPPCFSDLRRICRCSPRTLRHAGRLDPDTGWQDAYRDAPSYVVGLATATDRRQARAQQHLPLARAPRVQSVGVQIALVAGAPSQAAAGLGGKPPGARLTCAIRSPLNVIRLTTVPETSASSSAWSLAARSCIAAAGAPIYIRRAPASIAAVNNARRHCQTHWIGPAEPIMNDFQAASCRHSASAAARAGLKMSRRLRWRWWLKWWWTET